VEIDVERLGEDVPLLEGIRTTRAIRRLRADPVPRALIRKVCLKIQEEIPGRRKDDQHRDLVRKATALQKKVQEIPPAASDLHPA